MTLHTWLVYCAAVFVLTMTPGPSVLMVVSTSVNLGFRQAVLAALGSTSAIVGLMTLSALGLGAVLATSETLFSVLKWAGAAYLAYLGLSALLSRQQALAVDDAAPGGAGAAGQPRSFWRGFLVGASNPKALVFFGALFPQFVDPASAQGPQFWVLGVTFVVFELSWLLSYAALGARATRWLRQPGRALVFNRATGSVFLLAAGVLAMTRRHAA